MNNLSGSQHEDSRDAGLGQDAKMGRADIRQYEEYYFKYDDQHRVRHTL